MRYRALLPPPLAFLMMVCVAAGAFAQADEVAATAPMIGVTGGTADFQVLPRDAHDQAAARLKGRCHPGEGVIEARLTDRGAPVAGLDWRGVSEAKGGRWVVELHDLPVGGPYDVELRLLARNGEPLAETAVRNVLVGDLWVLAGQSNMQGVGKVSELPPPIATVAMFTMDDRWAVAREPLHPLFESRDEAHWQGLIPQGKTREEILPQMQQAVRARDARGVGPGLPFAWELYRLTGVPIGLIPCARGGTSLAQWSPEQKAEGGRSLYGAMLRRVAAAGGRVRGVLWYQGESDANRDGAATYLERFGDFVKAVRSDLHDPELPFLYVQIGRFIVAADDNAAAWNALREAQRLAEPGLGHAAVVPAVDCPLVDLIHLDTAGQIRVGHRLALDAARECFGREKFQRGPRLAQVSLDEDRTMVTILFEQVNGRLRAEGRPAGFVITDESGQELPLIIRVDLPEERPDTVELRVSRGLPENAQLWYARGMDPYVNLTDERDMGMLAFGPVPMP